MHYFKFNIGDYAKDTRHLSLLEDLAYRRLIDRYYDTELPLELSIEKLARLINMRKNQAEVEVVIGDFFKKTDTGYIHGRIENDIEEYQAKSAAARENGKKGGRPKKPRGNPEETQRKPKITQRVILANPGETGSKANQEPRTKNQEPRTKDQNTKAPDGSSEIFRYWRDVMNKSAATKPTAGRINKIRSRLKDGYTVDEIKKAIDGCRRSAYHMGDNRDGKIYNCLTLICRSAEKLDAFIGYVDAKPAQDRQTSNFDSVDYGEGITDL